MSIENSIKKARKESLISKIGIVSDGKYGERAFQNINKKFKTEWILVPEIPSTVMLEDDIELDIPDCDLYISYVRHPDIILQLARLQKPLILAVLPGIGLYEQAKRLNSKIIHAQTMCSLESNTGIPEVDEFTKFFGRPIYESNVNENGILDDIKVKRSSLCGSSEAGSKFLLKKQLNESNLKDFALNVCYECRAPRFGHTCDKEVAGIIHLVSLFDSFSLEKNSQLYENLKWFIENIKKEYERRRGK